ncbi:hypothetical protein ESZ50_03235 [Weissella muntiaci]|jgi:hypothetical protein|uniref:DUF3953 domain-containing protein n=1 Tax=Weissella muntiaci TaxID=2508881 RepID=A0A6C2C7S5_9LACO|nr:hypothetical protein [Weissella muntiaci]TYC50080.1 hypothetical protein ESZ50_03235 [Weissella muntiaci]
MRLRQKQLTNLASMIGVILIIVSWVNSSQWVNFIGLVFVFGAAISTYLIERSRNALFSLAMWATLILLQAFFVQ